MTAAESLVPSTPAATVSPAVAAVARIDAVPSILEVCCRVTGMGFAAVARVTEREWTACAVRDEIGFGLGVGGELAVGTTLCDTVRDRREAVAFDHAAEDPLYADHHTARLYGLQSCISTPILRADGSMFGTLCAIDPDPAPASRPETVEMFRLFAQLIAVQLDNDERLSASEAALLDARESAELRDQFIAVLGHDLRNPVAAIQAGATLLGARPLDDAARGIVDQMQASTARMGRLINDVLDFARGRLGGGLPLAHRSGVALDAVLQTVIDELRATHGDRDIQLDLTLTRPVDCDPDRIAQLLSNLVANALTHGSAEAPVRVAARSGTDGFTLSVANSGRPIPEAERARLFLPFSRPAADTPRPGLGLGLYIAARIAEAHHGTLSVTSDEHETCFTLRMPAG
ncbi:ATP-binding protein [Brevundimonas sp.]|uniref:GAF domain-containing sensor histidine kinase n=1 Tax=Brevundimonas sp. TaxID=1871086 RepID=UPI003A9358A6